MVEKYIKCFYGISICPLRYSRRENKYTIVIVRRYFVIDAIAGVIKL